MAYERTNWENREVERPLTYTMVENPDGTVTLTPAEGQIFSAGTPIEASRLNKIEQGLVDAHFHMTLGNPHNITPEKIGAYSKVESDARYEHKGAIKYHTLVVKETTQVLGANQWHTVTWTGNKYTRAGALPDEEGVTVPTTGPCLVAVGIGVTDITASPPANYTAIEIEVGSSRYRLDSRHYTSNGNFMSGGSVVVWANAGDKVKCFISLTEQFTIVGGANRSYMSVTGL